MRKIYKGRSKIHGEGVFIGEDLKKGDFIVFLRGKKIHWKYHHKTDERKCANWFGIGKDLWIDPDFPLSHINHSCNPNTGIKGKITLRALRDIKSGEELTFDYSSSDEEIEWTMPCHCGEKNCRKVMTAVQLLPRAVYNRYLPFVPSYFQRRYRSYNKLHGKTRSHTH